MSSIQSRDELDRKVVRSSAWLALSHGGTQVVSLVVTSVLAHLLTPSAFGLVTLASTTLLALGILQESGLGVALIQRRRDIEEAVASVFVFSTVLGVGLYAAAFAAAPFAASLLHTPGLTPVVRVLALVLVLRGATSATGAVIERELQFSRRARGDLAAVAVQAAVSVSAAVSGAGVWSLVAGQLAGQLVQTIVFWALAPIRPRLRLANWRTVRELGRFGRHVAAANFVTLVDGSLDTVTVGRVLGTAAVGYYNLAWRLSNLPATGLTYIFGRVMLPAYSSVADDVTALRQAYLANLRRITLVSVPLALGILLAARPIVIALFGHRWQSAVVPLQILAVFGLIRSLASTTGAVFQAVGRPQLVLWISTGHLFVLVGTLAVLTPRYGVEGVAGAMTITAFASLIPSFAIVMRILQLPLQRIARELERPVLCSLPPVLVLCLVAVAADGVTPGVELVLDVVCGLLAYGATVATVARAEVRAIGAALRS